jgi:hypothetical protein
MKFLIIGAMLILGATTVWFGREAYRLKDQVAKLEKDAATENCDPCGKTIKQEFKLNIATLDAMSDAYCKSSLMQHVRIPQSNGRLAPEDAKSVWFSMDDLQAFIDNVRKDVCAFTCRKEEPLQLGIRLYYARYPDFNALNSKGDLAYPDLQGINKDYENLHTIFMVPTYNEKGEPKDFNPADFNNEKCVSDTIKMDGGPSSSILAFMPDMRSKNHGRLCPPVCTGNGFEAFGK